MRPKILLVDDESAILEVLCSALAGRYDVDAVASGKEALRKLAGPDAYAAVMTDMIMSGVNGIEVLAATERRNPFTTRVMLTGDLKRETTMEAVNQGHVFRFLAKPISLQQLHETVELAVKRYEMLMAEQELLDGTLRNSINILLEVASTIDPQSFELSQSVRRTIRKFAQELGFPNPWELEMAAALARIGTATLPSSLLRGRFSDHFSPIERKLLESVPEIGWQLLKAVPRLERVAEAVRYQGKDFDGSGLPADSLVGEQIPLAARVLRIFTDRALLEFDGIRGPTARKVMESRSGAYDPMLLATSFNCFPAGIFHGITADAKVHMTMASNLRPNQIVVKDIKTKDGLIIVAAGSGLTAMMIHRIWNYLELRLISQPFFVQDISAEE